MKCNAKLQGCHIVRYWRLDGKVWWAGWRIGEGTQKVQLRNAPIEQLAQIHIGSLYLLWDCLVCCQRLSKLLDERCGHKTATLHSTSRWSIWQPPFIHPYPSHFCYLHTYMAYYGSHPKDHAGILVSEWHLQIWTRVFASIAKGRKSAAKGFSKGLNTTALLYEIICIWKHDHNSLSRFCWGAKGSRKCCVRAVLGNHNFKQLIARLIGDSLLQTLVGMPWLAPTCWGTNDPWHMASN